MTVESHWVAESWYLNLVPSPTEDKITLENLIFKSSSKAPLWSLFLHSFLNLSSDSTDSPKLSSLKLSHLKFTVEHTLNKSCILVNLKRLSNQLELLHNFKLRIQLHHYTSHTDSKVSYILPSLVLQSLDSYESCAYCEGWSVEDCMTVTEFRCVFNHAISLVFVFSAENWY